MTRITATPNTGERERLERELAAVQAEAARKHTEAARIQAQLTAVTEREQREAAERAAKQAHIMRINELLETAKRSLQEAAAIGNRENIEFTFITPKGENENFRPGWQHSACYASDGWYYHDNDDYGTDWNASGTGC